MESQLKIEFETKRKYYKKRLPSICYNCESTKDLTIHHIVPIIKGGTNRLNNLAVLCSDCHNKVHGAAIIHRELQIAGIQKAMKNGVHLGRPKTPITNNFEEIYTEWKAGKITGVQATARAGVSKATFYRMVKDYEKEINQQ